MAKFAKALIEQKIDINKSFQKESALHHAVAYHNHGAAKVFLENGIKDIAQIRNERDSFRKSCFKK